MNTPPNSDETKTPPARRWVWHCTEASIAAGQISVLAALETLCAVGLYGWLSFRLDWHWFSMVGLIAAPMLLLRSEESVELGVEMLRRWWKRHESDMGRWEKIGVVLVTGLIAGAVAYFLAQTWLPRQQGWALFWLAGMISVVAGAGAVAAAAAASGAVAARAAAAVAVAGAVAGAGAIAGAAAAAVTVAVAFTLVNQDILRVFAVLLLGPGYALGIILRAVYIRWFASLRYLLLGLKRLPRNWRENLWVIDLSHAPELLPQSGRVQDELTVAGLWNRIADIDGVIKVLLSILISAIYLPALAYRWSIKASAWLWWPLALALTPPFEGLDGYKLRRRAAIVSRGAWSKLLLLALPVLLAWLAFSLNLGLKEWLHDLSPNIADFADRLLTAVPPPPLGLRFGLLCLALVLAGLLLWLSNDLAASYPEVLDGPKGYDDLNDAQKADFKASARPMERLRLLFIVTLFLLGEAVALAFLHGKNPAEIERLIWPCLLAWL